MPWNENATGYFLADDLEVRSPTNEEANSFGRNGSVIGVVCGTHFVPGGLSRNKRYYPEDDKYGRLWETQIKHPQVVEKLQNNTMYGTIGHDTEITEKELREGKVSHFTRMLKIIPTGDPKKPYKGYAESYILNTPAGNLLKTYLESSKLFVSSRADGDFLPGARYKVAEDGSEVPVLDPNKFRLERFDFVINPGFFDAHPTLKEDLGLTEGILKSMNEAYQECEKHLSANIIPENSIKENSMSVANGNELINKSAGDVVIKVTDDNAISISMAKGTGSHADGTQSPHNKGATATKDTNKDGAAEVTFSDKEQNTLTEEIVAAILKQNEELKAQVKSLQEAVASDAKPDIKDISKDVLDKTKAKLDPQHIVGGGLDSAGAGLDDLVKAMKAVKEAYARIGDPSRVEESMGRMFNLIQQAGGVEALANDILFHEAFGTCDEIARLFEVFRQYKEAAGDPGKSWEELCYYREVFEDVGEPNDLLQFTGYLRGLCEQHGNLDDIAKKLEYADSAAEFFQEFGAPSHISSGLQMLEQLTKQLESFQELGVGNVADVRTILLDLQETKLKNQALAISEHTGLDSDKVEKHLRDGLCEEQIVKMYNYDTGNYFGKFLTVRENATGSSLDKIPLKTVDSDGNHIQLTNASWKVDLQENMTPLDRVLSRVTNYPAVMQKRLMEAHKPRY